MFLTVFTMQPVFQVAFLFLCWCSLFFSNVGIRPFSSALTLFATSWSELWRGLERIMAPWFYLSPGLHVLQPTYSASVSAKQHSLPLPFIFFSCSIKHFRTRSPAGVLQHEALCLCHLDVTLPLSSWQQHSWQAECLQGWLPECQTPTHMQTHVTPPLGLVPEGSLTKPERWTWRALVGRILYPS